MNHQNHHAPALCAIAVLMLALLSACTQSQPMPHTADEGQPMMILTEWHGTNSEQEQADFQVIRSEREWERAWEKVNDESDPPMVDFQQQMVLAAWMGQQRTGGYAIRIREIRETDNGYEAVIVRREPGPDQIVTQALTSPYHLVVVPRTSRSIEAVDAD